MNPEIAAQQQGSPLRQAAQGGMGGAQEAMQGGAPSMQLVKKLMSEVGERLNGVAKILQNEKPEMIPLLKPVVQGLAMLMNDVEKSAGGAQQGGAPQGAAPSPEADPQGGAAMGMASNGGGSAPAAA